MSLEKRGFKLMEKIIESIKKSKKISVLTHISEDADALGSAIAFKKAMESIGKTVDIYVSDIPEERLEILDKDYIIYTEGMQIPDYDLCASLDSADLGRIKDREVIFNSAKTTVNIDHHKTNKNFAIDNYVVPGASSTGEVVYTILDRMGIEITKEIAKALYIAIITDSGCFKYESVTPKTMEIAARLMEKDIDHAEICRRLFDTESPEIMRLKGYFMSNFNRYYDGKLCIVVADQKLLTEFNVSEKDLGDLVNIPRMIKGCEIAVSVRGVGDKTKMSLRSNGKFDVSEIASEFGGGGHRMAAGITLSGINVMEAERLIVKAVEKLFK